MRNENKVSKISRLISSTGIVLGMALSGCNKGHNFSIAPATEKFGQYIAYNNKVDVLWVVDNSESMEIHQNNIAAQFGSFVDVLAQNEMDFNFAITTTDMSFGGQRGSFVGTPKVLNSLSPSVKEDFFNGVRVGTLGSALSRGLEAMKAALSAPLVTGGNSGFLRPDARLVVIFVTDDDDHSAGTSASFGTFLDQIRPEFAYKARGWMVNFIGVKTPDGGCVTGTSKYGYPGDRYMELVNLSGGISESICSSDLSPALQNIRSRIAVMVTEYVLKQTPVSGSLRVYVNGAGISEDPVNGYTYIPETRVVRFNGNAIPGANAIVTIDYQPTTSK